MIPNVFGGGGQFMKADDVVTGDKLVVIDEGQERTSSSFKYPDLTQKGTPHPMAGQFRKEFYLGVELPNGNQKQLKLNSTSYNLIAPIWGRDTSKWVDRQLVVEIFKLPTGNKMIQVSPASAV